MRNYIQLLDVYPNQAFYPKACQVGLIIHINYVGALILEEPVRVNVYRNYDLIKAYEIEKISVDAYHNFEFRFDLNNDDYCGYGVEIVYKDQLLSTAFDCIPDWHYRPRYGFLSDFYLEDEEDDSDAINMLKYHINVVQFYDWMYKHEDLIPKEDYYIDLLERELSKKAVEHKISACHLRGIKTLGYGAIYAASKSFYEAHKSWALYTNSDQPQNLGDWFYIMNISEVSPWRSHIIQEFQKAIEVFDFDGIHMDTYGFPKTAYSKLDGVKKIEYLDKQFPSLIGETKQAINRSKDGASITFNAVSNWAIETIAPSDQDAIYIEVWDPQDRYNHLYQLVSHGKELGKKQVILAAYMKAYAQKERYSEKACHIGWLLASATIFASGGFHFTLGEENGILPDPYYVKYEHVPEAYVRDMRNYYDFIVRYGNLLFDLESEDISMTYGNGINTEYLFKGANFSSYPYPDRVWTMIKSHKQYKTINLINYSGIQSDLWNEGKDCEPDLIQEIEVSVLIDETLVNVFYASPDWHHGKSEKLAYDIEEVDRGNAISFKVPYLKYWGLVYIEIEESKG